MARFLYPAFAAVLVLAASTAIAHEGWTMLFDGKSTRAWRGYNRPSIPEGRWEVETGHLPTVASAPDVCAPVTRRKYPAVALALESTPRKGGNSRSPSRAVELPGTPTWPSPPELQTLDDSAH